MARNPPGYWTRERIDKVFGESVRQNNGKPLSSKDFQARYGRAHRMLFDLGLTYNKYVESRGMKPPNQDSYSMEIGEDREIKVDSLLEEGPKFYQEIAEELGVGIKMVSCFFKNSMRRRRKYGAVDLNIMRGYWYHRGKSDSDLFCTNYRILAFLKSSIKELPKYLAGILNPKLNSRGKSAITHILRNQITDKHIEEMWRRYKELEEMELEEMGVLLQE